MGQRGFKTSPTAPVLGTHAGPLLRNESRHRIQEVEFTMSVDVTDLRALPTLNEREAG
ncbi:MAG TPA: hypothetical protein VIL09_08150 [Microvirga sp.]|jgi:hypothetical protein